MKPSQTFLKAFHAHTSSHGHHPTLRRHARLNHVNRGSSIWHLRQFENRLGAIELEIKKLKESIEAERKAEEAVEEAQGKREEMIRWPTDEEVRARGDKRYEDYTARKLAAEAEAMAGNGGVLPKAGGRGGKSSS
jgi:hypothetical protein